MTSWKKRNEVVDVIRTTTKTTTTNKPVLYIRGVDEVFFIVINPIEREGEGNSGGKGG